VHDRNYHHKLGSFSFPGATVNEKILLACKKCYVHARQTS
jgi:hypothetical protein